MWTSNDTLTDHDIINWSVIRIYCILCSPEISIFSAGQITSARKSKYLLANDCMVPLLLHGHWVIDVGSSKTHGAILLFEAVQYIITFSLCGCSFCIAFINTKAQLRGTTLSIQQWAISFKSYAPSRQPHSLYENFVGEIFAVYNIGIWPSMPQ